MTYIETPGVVQDGASVTGASSEDVGASILEAAGIITDETTAQFMKTHFFNRYNMNTPDVDSTEYTVAFMTRPTMNILEIDETGATGGVSAPLQRVPKLGMIANQHSDLMPYLDAFGAVPTETPFLFPLMNRIDQITLLDPSMRTVSSAKNMRGLKMEMGVDYSTTLQDVNFNITFKNDKRGTALNLISFWGDMIEAYKLGEILPRFDNLALSKGQAVIDYGSTVYVFTLGSDMKSIKFYAEYTGAWPKDKNFSAYDGKRVNHNAAEATVSSSFYAPFYTALDPTIIGRFNTLAMGDPDPAISTYLLDSDKYLGLDDRSIHFYWADKFAITFNEETRMYEMNFMSSKLANWLEAKEVVSNVNE